MKKTKLLLSAAGLSLFAAAAVSLPSTASAASISMTGPGSTNVIRSSQYGGNGSLYMTGPGSYNVISSQYNRNTICKDNKYNNYSKDRNCNCKPKYNMYNKYNKDRKCKHEEHNKYCGHQTTVYYKKPHVTYSNYHKQDSYKKKDYKHHKKQVVHKKQHKTVVFSYDHPKNTYEKKDYKKDNRKNDNYRNSGQDYNKYLDNKHSTRVENNNNVEVRNNVSQYARSGNATVEGNTIGGSAYSGNASNSSYASYTVGIRN